ncbi:MAG: tagatose 1,6-diphosphate aldolase [Anaerolineaceae bacterium]|nr:tagatose 1,6-diphosphate aldolase [Anaerolineaceae bacterium]
MTTMGKYRHLSRTATPAGHFVIMAIDHRTNLLENLNAATDSPLSDSDFVVFKQQVLQALGPHSSAVLTDPAYGIGEGIVSGTLPGQLGLLAPIEVTDYGLHPSQRPLDFIPNWSVKKIKMMGGDGVKLLLPYHPDADNAAEKHASVEQIIDDCDTYDIPFFLEPIPYSLDSAKTLPNDELLQVSIAMCKTFSEMGVDVLKLPFPVDAKQSQEDVEWIAACLAVDAACSVPWALLSAGVSYKTFLQQSQIACQAGASGVIVGRAVWAEAVELQGDERTTFLADVAPRRMQELADVCAQFARPWTESVDKPASAIDWYETYQA